MAATKAQQAKTAERRRAAVELRIAGTPWHEIARLLGYDSKASAYTDVRRALEKAVTKLAMPVETLRELQLQRLDAQLVRLQDMQEALWPKVMEGDLRAIETGLRIEEARRRNGQQRNDLLGLDAPQRHELTLEALDAAIEDYSAQLAAARSEASEGEEAPEDPG